MTQTLTLKEAKAKKETNRLYHRDYQRRLRAAAKAEEADRASITDAIDCEAYRASGGVVGIPNGRCRYCGEHGCSTCEIVMRSHSRCNYGRCDEGLCGG